MLGIVSESFGNESTKYPTCQSSQVLIAVFLKQLNNPHFDVSLLVAPIAMLSCRGKILLVTLTWSIQFRREEKEFEAEAIVTVLQSVLFIFMGRVVIGCR